MLVMRKKTEDGFRQFLIRTTGTNAGTANSYMRAIAKTDAAMQRHQVFLNLGESIFDIQDVKRLEKLYDLILQEQEKGTVGIFREEKSTSYWRKNFCSAAIARYIEYIRLKFSVL